MGKKITIESKEFRVFLKRKELDHRKLAQFCLFCYYVTLAKKLKHNWENNPFLISDISQVDECIANLHYEKEIEEHIDLKIKRYSESIKDIKSKQPYMINGKYYPFSPDSKFGQIMDEDFKVDGLIISSLLNCHMAAAYNLLSISDSINHLDYFALEKHADDVRQETFRLFGYWKAKMEETKRNVKNVGERTKTKSKKMETVKTLLEKHSNKINRELIIEAMRQTDRGERTVKNMIKEINKLKK
jgi:hypothetical protein